MCDEHVEYWSSREIRSRTWKPCCECRGLIAPGDLYVRTSLISDGTAWTENRHVACDQLACEIADLGEGCRYESMWSELQEWGPSPEQRYFMATLQWMRTRTRARFARALGEAWGVSHA